MTLKAAITIDIKLKYMSGAEVKKVEKKTIVVDEGGFTMSAKDQLTMDDYVLPYFDDSDTEEEDQ